MGEKEGGYTPEELAEIQQERTLADAELIQGELSDRTGELELEGGGAKYIVQKDQKGEKQVILNPTAEQVESARGEMRGKIPEEAHKYIVERIKDVGITEGDAISVNRDYIKFLRITETELVGTSRNGEEARIPLTEIYWLGWDSPKK